MMTRRKKEPLRLLTQDELFLLERIILSESSSALHVAHAKEILAVAAGFSYTEAALMAGKKSRKSVSLLIRRFNEKGLQAI